MTTTTPRRDEHAERLVGLFAAGIGRPATPGEVADIARAAAEADAGGTLSAVALGYIAGTNRDWPESMVRAALVTLGLDAFPVE